VPRQLAPRPEDHARRPRQVPGVLQHPVVGSGSSRGASRSQQRRAGARPVPRHGAGQAGRPPPCSRGGALAGVCAYQEQDGVAMHVAIRGCARSWERSRVLRRTSVCSGVAAWLAVVQGCRAVR
jgi:hypothetical protein